MSRTPTPAQLGGAIQQVREDQGISVAELAARAGLNAVYVNSVEQGERNPTWRNIADLAAALDIRVSVLVALAEYDAGEAEDPA